MSRPITVKVAIAMMMMMDVLMFIFIITTTGGQVNRQQAIAKSRCSKGVNSRSHAVFCCAILLFADLERAGGEVILADGEVIMAGGEGMIAGPTSRPLHPTTHHSQNYSHNVLLNT